MLAYPLFTNLFYVTGDPGKIAEKCIIWSEVCKGNHWP